MKRLALVLVVFAQCGAAPNPRPPEGMVVPTFHLDRARTGWFSSETSLTPANVGGGGFGVLWTSPQLDPVTVGDVAYDAHVFASPVYADGVTIGTGELATLRTSVVFAATTSGYAYAIDAFPAGFRGRVIPPGTILWRTALGQPVSIPALDGGLPLGVLSTPVLDMSTTPGTLYVASVDGQGTPAWKVYALDVTTGALLLGWPVTIDSPTMIAVDTNRGTPAPDFQAADAMSQRGALALSPDGGRLYVPFGSYADGGVGWTAALDTRTPRIVASFSATPTFELACDTNGCATDPECTAPGAPCHDACLGPAKACPLEKASGGMWAAAGPAIDDTGRVFVTTGNGPPEDASKPGVWSQSLCAWSPSMVLADTYTPFNFCATDAADADIAGSAPVLFDVPASRAPRLAIFGSKQGDVYLVDRDHLGGNVTVRPMCNPTDSSTDTSFVPPNGQPYYMGKRGPLNVFGPYSDKPTDNNLDHAKMRSTAAVYRAADGTAYAFVAGTTKAADDITSVPPSVVKLRVSLTSDGTPYLAVAQAACAPPGAPCDVALKNPGSPVVSSNGPSGAVVWVKDENQSRTDPLVPTPTRVPAGAILYAFDGETLQPLWQSNELETGGKYDAPIVVHGTVIVGTDRIRGFGLLPQR